MSKISRYFLKKNLSADIIRRPVYKAYIYSTSKVFYFIPVISEQVTCAAETLREVQATLLIWGYKEQGGVWKCSFNADKSSWVEIHMEQASEISIAIMKQDGIYRS